ncbi:MAG: hypothetical protein ABJK59_03565 [Erythrobacter sp.]|uniref:hypothetical protein n=1 Tax=Erythrobacter sp. TaxID=1042 RepID=UPI003297F306
MATGLRQAVSMDLRSEKRYDPSAASGQFGEREEAGSVLLMPKWRSIARNSNDKNRKDVARYATYSRTSTSLILRCSIKKAWEMRHYQEIAPKFVLHHSILLCACEGWAVCCPFLTICEQACSSGPF